MIRSPRPSVRRRRLRSAGTAFVLLVVASLSVVLPRADAGPVPKIDDREVGIEVPKLWNERIPVTTTVQVNAGNPNVINVAWTITNLTDAALTRMQLEFGPMDPIIICADDGVPIGGTFTCNSSHRISHDPMLVVSKIYVRTDLGETLTTFAAARWTSGLPTHADIEALPDRLGF